VNVVETPNALRDNACCTTSAAGPTTCTGPHHTTSRRDLDARRDESIRTVRYLDLDVIRDHPRYSWGSRQHRAHLVIGSGNRLLPRPSLLTGFAENGSIHPKSRRRARRVVHARAVRAVAASEWTEEFSTGRVRTAGHGRRWWPTRWQWLSGTDAVTGELIAATRDPRDGEGHLHLPDDEAWDGAIVLLETSEEVRRADVKHWLRNYLATGVLDRLGALSSPAHGLFPAADVRALDIVQRCSPRPAARLPVVANVDTGTPRGACCRWVAGPRRPGAQDGHRGRRGLL